MLKSQVKRLLTKLGPHTPYGVVHGLNAVANYLAVGRWFREAAMNDHAARARALLDAINRGLFNEPPLTDEQLVALITTALQQVERETVDKRGGV
jgi:hypothetical protein